MVHVTGLVTAVLAPVLFVPLLAFTGLGGINASCQPTPVDAPGNGPASAAPVPAATTVTVTGWDGDQLANAAAIVAVGQAKAVPPWGWVVAVATAIQESQLHNLPGGDRDSIGLFQQRPSQGWGTPAQLASPTYQAGKFYDALLAVPDWPQLPLTEAAQAVQHSATRNAYTKWTSQAIGLVADAAPGNPLTSTSTHGQDMNPPGCWPGNGGLPGTGETLPPGYTIPPGTPAATATAITWALAQLGTPYSFGGDCTAAHSTDPSRRCDCSSLVQMAFHTAGIALPRTTTGQVHVGTPVPTPAQLQPGDLIFIPGSNGTKAAPRHVGLYIGRGLIINAPQTGDRVKLTPLAAWTPMIAAIRRPVS
jgi:cell wall-associated NlpC family hydrolase